MIELPEGLTIAKQMNETIRGKTVQAVYANQTPHKFAFYFNEPKVYGQLLSGRTIEQAEGLGRIIELTAGEYRIVFGDGANPRYYADAKQAPKKHQLYIEFTDASALVCVVQMYGEIQVFQEGQNQSPYYWASVEKPMPVANAFDIQYFESLRDDTIQKLSAKAFLATEQRIPGLGNGVLQDILYRAGIHPKRKMNTLSDEAYEGLYHAVKTTLAEMTAAGGRDTEKDLFGCFGGYQTRLSKKTVGTPCLKCGTEIKKAAYLGGAIYYCEHCQRL